MSDKFCIAVHGGVFQAEKEYGPQLQFLENLLKENFKLLANGSSALDSAAKAVAAMEDSGLFNAGKGSISTTGGQYELDACVMDGASGRTGAVAVLRNFKNPVLAARKVMEESAHVLMVGKGAEKFLMDKGMNPLQDLANYFSPANPDAQPGVKFGTVGAIALDKSGNLAAATSTGGVRNQMEGRVGDTPIIGASTWADRNIAVSSSGQGEYFIRTAAARDVAALCEYAGKDLGESIDTVLAKITAQGGKGGMITLNRQGAFKVACTTKGMHFGHVSADGRVRVGNHP